MLSQINAAKAAIANRKRVSRSAMSPLVATQRTELPMTTRHVLKPAVIGLGVLIGLAGCTNPYDPGQRAVGGGLIGAGAGAAIGGVAGGGRGAVTGALVGGAVGAVAGAGPPPPPPRGGPPPAPPGGGAGRGRGGRPGGAVAGAATTPPPPVYAPPAAPAGWYPEIVWLPQPGAYIALDYSYPLFFIEGTYYSLYGGNWYAGPSYRGPWHAYPSPPPALHGFHPGTWNSYQERARTHYRADPNWRHFRPR